MVKKIEKVRIKQSFKVCPTCGYRNGFHAMFERIGKSTEFSWKLICPQCGQVFDAGLKVRIEDQEWE